jgi:hypothetical protein
VRLEGLSQLENPMTSLDSNLRPSGLYHSASTNYSTACLKAPTECNVTVCCDSGYVKIDLRDNLQNEHSLQQKLQISSSQNGYYPKAELGDL